MKKILLLNILIINFLNCFAQIKCEGVTIWEIRLENGKQLRSKSTANKTCKDAKGNIVEQSEFGQGRELQYYKNEFDTQNRPLKEYYRHGYEGNDGGEGTITYQYVGNNKIIISYVAVNFSRKTEVLETKNAKKQVIKRVENMTSKSEVLPDYNSKSKTTITYEYAKNDSLSKKTTQNEEVTTTELYQYKDGLRTRYESKYAEGTKTYSHYVTTYQYDAQKRLVEERNFEMPKYITKSLKTKTYAGDKITEQQETHYTNFAEKKITYQTTTQFSYDEKGELVKEIYTYQNINGDKEVDENQYTTQGNTKIVTTVHYRNEEKTKRTKEIQTFQGAKLMKSEVYVDEVLDYILEYEYL